MAQAQEGKKKQVLLCASPAQVERATALFPALEVRYLNGAGYDTLEGRKVVCLGLHIAHFASAYAVECKWLPEEIPSEIDTPKAAMAWAVANREVYQADDQRGAGLPAGYPKDDKTPFVGASTNRTVTAPLQNSAPRVAASSPDLAAGKASGGAPPPSDSPPPPAGAEPEAAPQDAKALAAEAAQERATATQDDDAPIKIHNDVGLIYSSSLQAIQEWAATPIIPPDAPGSAQDEDAPLPFPDDEAPHSGHWEQSLDGWPQPVDFWGDETGFMPGLEADMLPGWLMDYVSDQAALRGVDPVQPALQCLLAFSGALHNSHGLRPKPGETDYIERPVLWGATVGNPSTKKDAGQAIALSPLIPLDVEMRRRTAQLMQDRADADHAYQEALAAWRKGKQVGPRPVAPEPVPMDRLLVDNFTLEGLRGVLEHNSRGKVLVAVSELAGVFGNADAFTNNKGASKDMPMLLRLYQSSSMIVDRAPPAPPVFVKSWAASIAGAIQPNIFHRVVQKMHLTDDGMLPRFLLVLSKNASAGEERPADYRAAENYRRVIGLMVSMLPGQQPCHLSPEAQGVRRDLLGWIYRIAGSGALTDGLASAVGKFEGAFARLCLVLHASECAQASLPVIAPEVSEATAVRARTLLLQLFYPHAAKFYADLGTETNYLKIPALIAAYILHERVGALNATMLWRGLSSWRHMDKRQRDDALRTCCESGWLRKRGETNYIVNPSVHDLFVKQREREDDRRARLTAIMREKMGAREPGSDD